jgi:hypothetical protein
MTCEDIYFRRGYFRRGMLPPNIKEIMALGLAFFCAY